MLCISRNIAIPDNEIEIHATGAGGPGGQSVNKSTTAVHLRFDVKSSSLPEEYKQRILTSNDHRVTKSGVIVIKSQRQRSFEANRQEALNRLYSLIKRTTINQRIRKPTRPKKSAERKRLDRKTQRGRVKTLRGKVDFPRD